MKVIDMHCDTLCELLRLQEEGKPENLRQNNRHVDLLRMKENHYLIQNFAMFVALSECDDPWEQVRRLHGLYEDELAQNRDILAPVLRYADIAANEAAGKLSSMLTVEEGAVCKGEIEKLRELYRMGVRMITLTWNFENELGQPNFDPEVFEKKVKPALKAWESCPAGAPARGRKRQEAQRIFDDYNRTPNLTGGLTEKGREFVTEMESLGIIPDVSHLSDAGFYDVLEVTKKPFAASHSDARAVCPCVRNLTDDMIRALAGRGGVMGMNFCPDFLEEKPLGEKNPGTIAAAVRHAKHIVNTGGIEVLGLGSDFDGIPTHAEIPGAQGMEALWEGLHKAGFTEGQLDKIFWRNVLRVYGETLR